MIQKPLRAEIQHPVTHENPMSACGLIAMGDCKMSIKYRFELAPTTLEGSLFQQMHTCCVRTSILFLFCLLSLKMEIGEALCGPGYTLCRVPLSILQDKKIWKEKPANKNYFSCLATKQSPDEMIRARHRSATLRAHSMGLRNYPSSESQIPSQMGRTHFLPFQSGRLSRPDQDPGRTRTRDRAMGSPRTCHLTRTPGLVASLSWKQISLIFRAREGIYHQRGLLYWGLRSIVILHPLARLDFTCLRLCIIYGYLLLLYNFPLTTMKHQVLFTSRNPDSYV